MYASKFFSILTIAAAMTACSDNNTIFNEPSQIRAYETDAQIYEHPYPNLAIIQIAEIATDGY